MKKSNIKNTILISLLFVIIFGLLSSFSYLFVLLDKKNVSIKEIRGKIKTSENTVKNRNDLKELIRNLGDKKGKIDSAFLKSDNLFYFIERVEEIAKISGVSVDVEDAGLNLKKYPKFSISVEGGYSQVFSFMELIENMPYKIEISSVGMQEQGTSSGYGQNWKADIGVSLLSYI